MAIKKKTNNQIRILLWGKEIGTLTWLADRKMSYFYYSNNYFRQPYDLTPIANPKSEPSTKQAIYGASLKDPDPGTRIYQGLPPFIADSLPDQWGNAIFEQWFRQNNYPESAKTPITKLSFLGNRAMGAFEFAPMMDPDFYKDKIVDIKELYKESLKIEKELSAKSIKKEEATIENIAALGTSPGGSRKKAIISIAPDGTIHSGKTSIEKDWKHCIIKFNTERYSLSETEMVYYELAKESGITMMHSDLYEIENIKHFITERFDRRGGKKIMMQTLAAINPEANSYEDLFRTCRILEIPAAEITGLFKQTAFNFLMNNTDDHKKNFSFIMDDNYRWHLSPAYDITFIIAENGTTPERTHCMSLNGKYENITEKDLIDFANNNDITGAEKIIRQIRKASLGFEEKAEKYGINGYYTEMISKRLDELGRREIKEKEPLSVKACGKKLENIRFEMSSKGHLHLCTEIEGVEQKIVLTDNHPMFKEIKDKRFNLMEDKERKAIFKKAFENKFKITIKK